jgi:hypothetical protein
MRFSVFSPSNTWEKSQASTCLLGAVEKPKNLQKKSSEEARGSGNHPFYAMFTNAMIKSPRINYMLITAIEWP